MRETHAYSWTYWAGAAVMLRVDAALRARSAARSGSTTRCALGEARGRRASTARALSADADALVGTPGLVALARARVKEFPDLAPSSARSGRRARQEVARRRRPLGRRRRAIAAGGAPAAGLAAPGGAETPVEPAPGHPRAAGRI
jgi:hypothetical protein